MSWTTVYIRGRPDFQSAVVSKLEGLWLLGSPETEDGLLMYWLPDKVLLKTLKRAIGSKILWKYRLHFITNLNNHLQQYHSYQLSVEEREMINKMARLYNEVR